KFLCAAKELNQNLAACFRAAYSVESPLSFLRMHWDLEPPAVPRRTESADKSGALQTLRAVRRHPALAKRLDCVRLQRRYPKTSCDSMPWSVHGQQKTCSPRRALTGESSFVSLVHLIILPERGAFDVLHGCRIHERARRDESAQWVAQAVRHGVIDRQVVLGHGARRRGTEVRHGVRERRGDGEPTRVRVVFHVVHWRVREDD